MKTIIFFISITTFLFKLDVSLVRKEYKEAVQSKTKTLVLYNKLQKVSKKDNKALVAYKGAVTTLAARQQKAIKDKKAFFKKGVALVEYAIQSEPNNIEIRFVRLSIQQNTPKFLRYNKQQKEDKKFILKHLKNVKSTTLKEYISSYILQSKHFTATEKSVISQS